jgi:hypothetical protein
LSPLAISGVAFAFIFSGALAGMVLRRILPDAHLSADAKDVVRLSMGLIGTIAALVLGLLIASAKTSYDAKNTKLKEITINVILIDGFLDQYGPEALPARRALRTVLPATIDRIWREGDPSRSAPFEATTEARAFFDAIQKLAPSNDAQRSIQARVLPLSTELAQARLSLYTQAGNSIPAPFLAILVFWLSMIFASYSLFIRAEPVVIAALFVCALSAAGALFLILEMDRPFSGMMAISSEPLRNALAPL